MKNVPGRQRNPRVLGEDLGDVAWGTGGLFGVAVVNDKILAPIAKNVLPSVYGSDMFANIADALTTFATAYLGGWALQSVSKRGGELTQFTGSVLAGARFLSAFVPGFSLSAEVPVSLSSVQLPGLGGGNSDQSNSNQNSTPALPAGNAMAVSPLAPASPAYSLVGGA